MYAVVVFHYLLFLSVFSAYSALNSDRRLFSVNKEVEGQMARILVTGGAGFIGSNLCERLLADGNNVHAFDDLSTGSMTNIRQLIGAPGFEYTIASILEEDLLAAAIYSSDVVVHLAAAVGVRLVVDDPVNTITTNIRGSELVLRHASSKGRKVILASTSEVYGKGTHLPFREDDDMLFGPSVNSRWCYGCSKAIDEFLALAYARKRALPVVILRFFNVVGPRQTGRYGMVLPRFVQQALAGRPITVYGTGEQTRTFTHIADAIEAVTLVMNDSQCLGEVLNVGSIQEISINELADKVRRVVNPEVEIAHIPYNEAYGTGFEDMERRVPDTNKISRLLHFSPRHSVDDCIKSVADYFRSMGEDAR